MSEKKLSLRCITEQISCGPQLKNWRGSADWS